MAAMAAEAGPGKTQAAFGQGPVMGALFIPAGDSRLPLGPDALEVTGQAGVGDVHRGGVRLGVLGGTDIVSAVAILATDGDGRVSVMGPAGEAVAEPGGGLLMAGSAIGRLEFRRVRKIREF